MGAGDAALSEEIGAFRAEMKADHQALRGEMHAGDAALSEEVGALRAEMKAGFGELNTRVGGVEQRLSKVEGVIEGLFWSNRNEPPDRPGEGVA